MDPAKIAIVNRCNKLLKRIEWSGWFEEEPDRMGFEGRIIRACPACGGVAPGEGWCPERRGHKKNCKLIKSIVETEGF